MTAHPLRGSPAPRPPRRRALPGAATAGLIVLAPVAALGTLANPGGSLALGAIFAASAGTCTWALHRDPPDGRPPRAHPATVAAWAALLPAALAGGLLIGPAAVVLAVGAFALAVLAAAGWSRFRRPAPAVAEDRPAPADDGSMAELLQTLPMDVLCLEWRCTSGRECFPDGDNAAREHLRGLLLAELRRRDLAGTLRWRTEAPDAPPDRFVRDLRDRAA